jgi:uncharacterized protein DUF87
MELFPRGQVVGIFRGAGGHGFEFHADLTFHYQDHFDAVPMHGRFVMVELTGPNEAVLGRITAVAAQGRLTSTAGEEYGLRAVEEERDIPEDLRRHYVRYRIDVRLLGVLRCEQDKLVFAPSHRRLPHVGARVAFLSDDVLREIVGGTRGTEIGFYALGEFIYCGDDYRLVEQQWMRRMSPAVPVRFAVEQLVARRSFVFARAGFGKSNLVKLLFSGLYAQRPQHALASGKKVPVGTLIFDPDGEYFWPAHGKPGLCDVEELSDEIVVFTNQAPPTDFYASFRAGGVRLDIRQLQAALVLSIALSPEQQQQQNVHKLKSLRGAAWHKMVDLIHRDRISANEDEIRELLGLQPGQDAELFAARSHMVRVVQELHDPASQMLTRLLKALGDGKLCIVDISTMRGAAGLTLSGVILRHIFDYNQEQFTRAASRPVPTIAVIEEAQSVLSGTGSGESAYEEWVKEGRKYSLGAVLITQQPGSIPHELLSQGDSWFIFHLLSQGDLRAVKNANAHFSDDLLSSLLNEPLPGNGVFWSSVSGEVDQAGNAYPIPMRVLSFEDSHEVLDPNGKRGSAEVYASDLAQRSHERDEKVRSDLQALLRSDRQQAEEPSTSTDADESVIFSDEEEAGVAGDEDEEFDRNELYRQSAIFHLKSDEEFQRGVRQGEITWRGVKEALKRGVPDDAVPDVDQWAFELVSDALNTIVGAENQAWSTERRPRKDDPSRSTLWVLIHAK